MAYWPSRSDTKLPEVAIRDLELFAENLEKIPGIISISKQQAPGLHPEKIFETIGAEAELGATKIRRIFNTLENFAAFKEDLGTFEKALDRVLPSLSKEIRELYIQNRSQIISILGSYDKNNPVAISFKAQRLTYLRDKLLHDVEIVSDVRPIFNENGEEIVEFVVTHELAMTLLVGREIRREHITIDYADILALRKACDRALVKTQTIKKTLSDRHRVEVLRDDA